MTDHSLIYLLAGVTLILAVAIGLWQMRRTREAKRTNEHSALTENEQGRREMPR
jgi:cytochrome oxidase assembly protein ShyY1